MQSLTVLILNGFITVIHICLAVNASKGFQVLQSTKRLFNIMQMSNSADNLCLTITFIQV